MAHASSELLPLGWETRHTTFTPLTLTPTGQVYEGLYLPWLKSREKIRCSGGERVGITEVGRVKGHLSGVYQPVVTWVSQNETYLLTDKLENKNMRQFGVAHEI